MAPTDAGEGFADRLATWGIGAQSNEIDSAFPEPMPTEPMPAS